MSSPGTIVNDVLFGHNGYLFLASGAHKVLESVSGRLPVDPASHAAFTENLTSRSRWAEKKGVGYLHMIFPDKQSVLPEQWPFDPPRIMAEAFIGQAGEMGKHVHFPLEVLREHKAAAISQVDTHYTDFGSMVLACDLAARLLGASQRETFEWLAPQFTVMRPNAGDLGIKLTPKMELEQPWLAQPYPGIWRTNGRVNRNNGIIDLRFNPDAPHRKRILLVGDSFGRAMAPFLLFFFKEVHFFRTPFFHPEIADLCRPDHLITCCVERYLRATKADRERPFFFMYPHAAGDPYEVSAEFAEALSAVMSVPRPPYRKFAMKIGLIEGAAKVVGGQGPGLAKKNRPEGAKSVEMSRK